MLRWLSALATAFFVMAGFVKRIEPLASLPVDVTVLSAVVVGLLVVAVLVTQPVPQQVHMVVLGFLLLVPPALFTAPTVYGTDKTARLLTLTFLSILAPVVLIRDRADVGRHLFALTAMSGVVVVGALVDPQLSSDYEGAPITTTSVDTIGLGTAAAIVVVVVTLAWIWRAVPWLLAVPVDAAAVYVLLQSGSRGPLLSAALAVLVGAFLTRVRPRPRRSLAVVSLVGVGLVVAFTAAPLYSQLRIEELFAGDTGGSVGTRIALIGAALAAIVARPLGLGWGGYEQVAFGRYTYPHDLPLEVLVEAGLVLGTAFLIWLAIGVVRARAATVDFVGGTAFAVLVCLLGKALVSGDLNDNRVMFYALGIALAAYGLQRAYPDGVRRAEPPAVVRAGPTSP